MRDKNVAWFNMIAVYVHAHIQFQLPRNIPLKIYPKKQSVLRTQINYGTHKKGQPLDRSMPLTLCHLVFTILGIKL